MRTTLAVLAAVGSTPLWQSSWQCAAYVPPSTHLSFSSIASSRTCPRQNTNQFTRLYATDPQPPQPLATEGDWTAYLDNPDEGGSGFIYYFNGVTGESVWEPPTKTFPVVEFPAGGESGREGREGREERRRERRERRERERRERRGEVEETQVEDEVVVSEESGRKGFFGGLFGGNKEEPAASPSKVEALESLESLTPNQDFLNELDDVIAEAEEAIKIAEQMEEAPKKKGFFSAFGFGSEVKDVEDAIAKVEEKTAQMEKKVDGRDGKAKKGLFSAFGFGGKEKVEEVEEVKVEQKSLPMEGDNIWVEGLKNLFQRTYQSFTPSTSATDATATAKSTPKAAGKTSSITSGMKALPKATPTISGERSPKAEPTEKATVTDSDFLDVIWGAETSARPTLNIAEMMKAFQVEAKDESAAAPASGVEVETKPLTLDSYVQIKPHPDKVAWGGEDAAFISGRTFGVFDGVSGAIKERGKKLYSKSLADSMKKQIQQRQQSSKSSNGNAGNVGNAWMVGEITSSMEQAKSLADTEATGASTAVVASIGTDNVLRALNLGDSVCLVYRNGGVAARTREIVHYFDCPYQLGEDSPDRPKDGTTLQTTLYPGDIVIAGSDGVFDNLSDAQVCGIVEECGARAKSNVIAKKIVERSRAVSLDPNAVTPYAMTARGKSGYEGYRSGRGGKVDDISCVVVKAS